MRKFDQNKSPSSDQKSSSFLNILSKGPKLLLETLMPDESDIDRKEKQEVYLEIAKSFEEKFRYPLQTCLGATYTLCEEEDPFFLEGEFVNEQVEELSKLARPAILSINVSYEPSSKGRSYKRQIEIFFIEKEQVSVTRVSNVIGWDFLPPDVRENQLRHGKAAISAFALYSQES